MDQKKVCGNCRHFRYYLKRKKKYGIECGSCINSKACQANDSAVPTSTFPTNDACKYWKPWRIWKILE